MIRACDYNCLYNFSENGSPPPENLRLQPHCSMSDTHPSCGISQLAKTRVMYVRPSSSGGAEIRGTT